MSPRTLLYLYGWRLRAHPFQELLAGAGIAIGVALLFAVQVANHSITGSVEQLIHGITGQAQLELAARDAQGFDERLLLAVRALPGVETAAPSLERRAIVVGPRGRESIELIGVDPSLAALGGRATRDFGPSGLTIRRDGVLMPDRLVRATGTRPGRSVALQVGGVTRQVPVAATLTAAQIGPLTDSFVAVAPLEYVQQLVQMPGRISRVFVHARPDAVEQVRAALRQLAAGRLNVGPADSMVQRLRNATVPDDQSTMLFSAISAMIGVLFAFNAMLLTMPERRTFTAELRTQGFTPLQVVVVLGFQALMLGAFGSLGGLVLGDLLSRTVFHALPTYLAFTFPIGTQRVVPTGVVAISFATGILAALLATGRPLFDLLTRQPLDRVHEERGELGEGIGAPMRRRLLVAGVATVAAVTLSVVVMPRTTIAGVTALALALLLVMPAAFAATAPLLDRLARRARRNMLLVAVMGARSAMTRSIAVAAIASLAVFGSVAIGGARNDLVHGLKRGFADHVGTADLWITTTGQSLTTDPFRLTARELARLESTPEVAAVRRYRGGMLDLPDRRVWLVARPPDDREIVPSTQVVHGDAEAAERRLHAHGWATLSQTIATDLHVGVGDRFTLPTPNGRLRMRLAATTTNLGWGSGAVVLNTRDYRRGWSMTAISAVEVDLAPGVPIAAGRRAVRRALDPGRALDVQSARQLDDEFTSFLNGGLTRLTQISTLLVIAAALALAAAMSAAVWQRRQRLATYKVQGFREAQLRRVVLLEALVVLVTGSALGTAAGVYGHLLGNRWLSLTTGFPATFGLEGGQALRTLATIGVLAVAIVSVAASFAVRVSPAKSFRE
jgi:putative ABC transport system permease protein